MMQQSPPPPPPSVAGPLHQAVPTSAAPFLAAFTQAGLRAMEPGHLPGLHPAFLHPLYHFQAPGLATLRAAAAGAAAGFFQGASSPDRTKSFTIDAILGKEAEKLGISSHDREQNEKVLSNIAASSASYFHNNNNKDSENHRMKDSGVNAPVSYSYGGMRSAREGLHHHLHRNPHTRLGAPVSHPYLSQLTCAPGIAYRHHQSQYSRDKSEKKHSVSAEWKTGKAKRVRTIFTPEQLERLEAEFERQQYMVGTERYYLAASLNLTEAQVKVWFQNRRIKWRKQNLEQQHAKLAKLDMLAKHGDVESDSSDSDAETGNHDIDDVIEKEAVLDRVHVVTSDPEDQPSNDYDPLEHDR